MALVLIGNVLFSLNETAASIYWYLEVGRLISKIHQTGLLLALKNPLVNFYIKFFKKLLQSHPREHELSLDGCRFLSRLYVFRCEDLFLIDTYDCLIDGFLRKYDIKDLLYRAHLAAKFRQRPGRMYKSLALHLYLQTIKVIQSIEISGQKVAYDKCGCIFATIAVIYFERKMFGMANHYLNQALEQYLKHDPRSPPIDVYLFRAAIQVMLWKVTGWKVHLTASLNDLKEIDKNEQCTDKDYLFDMFVTYLDLKRYPLALDCLDRALLQTHNDSDRMIEIYRGRGLVHFLINQFDLALDDSHKALQYCSETNKQEQAVMHVAVALICERQEKWNTAIEHLKQALLIYEQNSDDQAFLKGYPLAEISHRHLSIAYEKVQNIQLASFHEKEATIEKERLRRLNVPTTSHDMDGFTVKCFVRQFPCDNNYTIPNELSI